MEWKNMERVRVITDIIEHSKQRYKIYIDEEFAFVLYKGELSTYKIKIGNSIEEKTYQSIITEVLVKRAKKRCLNLLKTRPYTEKQLRDKLKEGLYPPLVIEEAICYVKSFRYVDDYEYACQYIEYHKKNESRRKIEEKLGSKGIQRDILELAFADSYEDEEEQKTLELIQAKRLLEKKHYSHSQGDWKERQKLYAFLMRKGISSGIARKVLEVLDE